VPRQRNTFHISDEQLFWEEPLARPDPDPADVAAVLPTAAPTQPARRSPTATAVGASDAAGHRTSPRERSRRRGWRLAMLAPVAFGLLSLLAVVGQGGPDAPDSPPNASPRDARPVAVVLGRGSTRTNGERAHTRVRDELAAVRAAARKAPSTSGGAYAADAEPRRRDRVRADRRRDVERPRAASSRRPATRVRTPRAAATTSPPPPAPAPVPAPAPAPPAPPSTPPAVPPPPPPGDEFAFEL
jgi:hypothetical protein